MKQINAILQRVWRIIVLGKVVILAILALLLFGFALLQITSALDTSQAEPVSSDAVLLPQETATESTSQVEFSDDDLKKIIRLSGEDADIPRPRDGHSGNPFSKD